MPRLDLSFSGCFILSGKYIVRIAIHSVPRTRLGLIRVDHGCSHFSFVAPPIEVVRFPFSGVIHSRGFRT